MNKGFICTDLDKNAPWPSKFLQEQMLAIVKDRNVYVNSFLFPTFGLKPDKKTLQWWGKFAISKTFYDLHMFAHHLVRQTLNHVEANPAEYEKHSLKIAMMRKATNECTWKPKQQEQVAA